MSKEESDIKEIKLCVSVFKNGILTKEEYTKIWIELITVLERGKSVNFPLS